MNSQQQELGAGAAAAIWIAAVLVGAWWRIEGVTSSLLYGDEYHASRVAHLEFGEILRTFDAVGTHVPLPLLQRLSELVLGQGLLASRLPALVCGVLALVLIYPLLRPHVGRTAAAVGAAALAANPFHIHYSRFGRAYAIEMLLGIVLVWSAARLRESEWKSVPRALAFIALLGLLPWVHLSSAGLVAGVALAAIGLAWADAGAVRGAWRPALFVTLGALLAGALFLPTWDPLWMYIGKHAAGTEDRPGSAIAVLQVLGGSRAAAWVIGVGVLAALAWLARTRRSAATWLGGAVLGPVLLVLLRSPHGQEFAYARYLAVGLPLALVLVAWLVVRALGPRVGAAVGLALVAAGHLTGARAPTRAEDGPFDNTQLALARLPAFDLASSQGSAFYASLAADASVTTIVETPALTTRVVLLYRNHRMVHGKRVLMGMEDRDAALDGERRESFVPIDDGSPYVLLDDLKRVRERAQMLVLHKDVAAEVEAYWDWVYTEAVPVLHPAGAPELMRPLADAVLPLRYQQPKLVTRLEARLRKRLGEPIHDDPYVLVWDLR